jgi:hypothetical protein
VVCNAGQNIHQPCLGINLVQLGGFNQSEGDCHGIAAALSTSKHPILAAYSDELHGAFGGVVIKF